MSTPILLNIPTDGRLILSSEQLNAAGFQPGDRLVLTPTQPGQLYLHKAEVLPPGQDLREALQTLIQTAFQRQGYKRREDIVALVREVRQEMTHD